MPRVVAAFSGNVCAHLIINSARFFPILRDGSGEYVRSLLCLGTNATAVGAQILGGGIGDAKAYCDQCFLTGSVGGFECTIVPSTTAAPVAETSPGLWAVRLALGGECYPLRLFPLLSAARDYFDFLSVLFVASAVG